MSWSFIISGVFENRSREELKDLIESYGGKILSSISAKLSYVVAGANMGPAKLEKAQKLGIPIISDEDLHIPVRSFVNYLLSHFLIPPDSRQSNKII